MIKIPEYFPYYNFFNNIDESSCTVIVDDILVQFQFQNNGILAFYPPPDLIHFILNYSRLLVAEGGPLQTLVEAVINNLSIRKSYNIINPNPPFTIVYGDDDYGPGEPTARIFVKSISDDELTLYLEFEKFYQIGNIDARSITFSPRKAFLSFFHQQMNYAAQALNYYMRRDNMDFESIQVWVQSQSPQIGHQWLDNGRAELLLVEYQLIRDGIISLDELVATGGITILLLLKDFKFVKEYLLSVVHINLEPLDHSQKAVVVNILEIATCMYPKELEVLPETFLNQLIAFQAELIDQRNHTHGKGDYTLTYDWTH